MSNLFLPDVRRVVQWGLETTSGTPVTANRRFHDFEFDITDKPVTTPTRRQGNLFNVDHAPGKGCAEISVKSQAASVEDLILYFALLFGAPTFLSNTATFLSGTQVTNPKSTLTLMEGVAGDANADQMAYAGAISAEIDFTPEKDISFSGKMMAFSKLYDQTLPEDPTSLNPSVLFAGLTDVYLATTEDGLTGGKIKPLSVKMKADKLQGEVYTLDSDDASFSGLIESTPTLTYDLELPKGSLSNSLVRAIGSNDQWYMQIVARGQEMTGGVQAGVTLTSPVKWMNPGQSKNKDVWTVSLVADALELDDFHGGAAVKIDCVSLLTALS